MSKQDKIDVSEVAKTLKDPTAGNFGAANVLSKPDNTAQAKEEAAAAAAQSVEAQKAALDESSPINKHQVRKTRPERAHDGVKRWLEVYKTSPIGSPKKVESLQRIAETIIRYPKKAVLDEIFLFFKENIQEDFIQPIAALQNISSLEKSINIKVRIIYEIMFNLASGSATRKTISLDMIRTIFGSDDFVNWVAVKLPRR